MDNNFIAKTSMTIYAKAATVWQALTDPEMVKQYLFGTTVSSDWQKGSSLTYTGEWEGKPYEDKGTILEIIPGKLLKTNYWSMFYGQEDVPENRRIVTYELDEQDDHTTLTLTQENCKTQEEADHSAKNWTQVLTTLKAILEK